MSTCDSSKEYIIIENVLLFKHYSTINPNLYYLDPIEEGEGEGEDEDEDEDE